MEAVLLNKISDFLLNGHCLFVNKMVGSVRKAEPEYILIVHSHPSAEEKVADAVAVVSGGDNLFPFQTTEGRLDRAGRVQ